LAILNIATGIDKTHNFNLFQKRQWTFANILKQNCCGAESVIGSPLQNAL